MMLMRCLCVCVCVCVFFFVFFFAGVFVKAYVMGTHKSMQFKWVPTIHALLNRTEQNITLLKIN